MKHSDHNPMLREGLVMGPAIALLEVASIARGMEVASGILWEADIELLFATSVQPGKYVMLFTGSIEDLRSALQRGGEEAAGDLLDQLLIPQVHPQVETALRRTQGQIQGTIDALGVLETANVASAILAADSALKRANVDLLELRIANGLGGKSYVSLTGEVSDVRAAIAAGSAEAERSGQLLRQVVVPSPHPGLVPFL
ncbi:MAG: BMC domain-containing protein [Planctomycetes bacterium]|nr:BMC domain-containing protein [Planctomycetota bacterium]MCB9908703.1 BMC domain-containing protein [Planctomycetota bacterium]HPF13930.1 BMC domain-containing protein [Planctomycetota bacterium]HRV81239.1 BMC domain-containing protein [Planctomycetota bacterium]